MTPEEFLKMDEEHQIRAVRHHLYMSLLLTASIVALLSAAAWCIEASRDLEAAIFAAGAAFLGWLVWPMWRGIFSPGRRTRRQKKEDLVREVLRS